MDTKKRIGIIGAMESEIELIVGNLEKKDVIRHCGYEIFTGEINGTEVAVMRCGVGKVNAARGTQIMIYRFSPDVVINTGIAGAVDDSLRVGDAVIATGLVQHDFDLTAAGCVLGCMPGSEQNEVTVFKTDEKVSNALKSAAVKVLSEESVKEGIVATGDVFVAEAETRRRIKELFGAMAAEMEGSAIAQTANYAGVPVAVLRVMSDNADGEATESFEKFELAMARKSAEIIMEFLHDQI